MHSRITLRGDYAPLTFLVVERGNGDMGFLSALAATMEAVTSLGDGIRWMIRPMRELADVKDAPRNKEACARFERTEEGSNVRKRATGEPVGAWPATAGHTADQLNRLASMI